MGDNGRRSSPLLRAQSVTVNYGDRLGCRDISFDLWPGEVVGIVGESGSGKTTILNSLSGRLAPATGTILYANGQNGNEAVDVYRIPEAARRLLMRAEWGVVHQNPRDGLRMRVTAGANVGERLMAVGWRHYGKIRGEALNWLARVEIESDRMDDLPVDLFRGHAATPANCPYPGHPAPPGFYG